MDFGPTPAQTVGPFFEVGLTRQAIGCVAGPGVKGERVWLHCCVLDADGVPVDDAMIELWQADADGNYPVSGEGRSEGVFRGFGRMGTDGKGCCAFETIKPGRVPGPGGIEQAPHINLHIFARGLLKHLCTRVYFSGDPANLEDPVLASVPEDRRTTLMAQPDPQQQEHWLFDIHLAGDHETVFFDI